MTIFPLQENINKRAVSIISLEDLVSPYWKLSYSPVAVLPAPLLTSKTANIGNFDRKRT